MLFSSGILLDHEFVMCDARQERMFAALGRSRQLFTQAVSWPQLDEQISSMARQYLDSYGEDAWMSAGGLRDERNGHPSFRSSSPIVGELVRQIAEQHGGLRYVDESGQSWAIRLLPNRTSSKEEYLGVAVTLCDRIVLPGHETVTGVRPLPGGIAEQLLWSVFLAVRQQRSSLVVIPDVHLRDVIWGGNDPPANWRRDVFNGLRALLYVHFEVFHLAGGGWRPKVDASGVAIASVARLERGKPSIQCQVPGCSLAGGAILHGHFVVECGRCFLGALELFALEGAVNGRTYDFLALPTSEAKRQQLTEVKSAGHLISVHIPTKLYASARWSELTPSHRGILDCLLREVTRGRKSRRSDKAAVFQGRLVAGKRPNDTIGCPLLGPDDPYVAFGGNGRRRGQGYCLIGAKGRGWLTKCGYELPQNAHRHRHVVQKFLDDLAVVGQIIGLTVVGFDPTTCAWLSFDDMLAMASNTPAFKRLERVWLRPYAPPDYHLRLVGYYEERGQLRDGVRPFAEPPNSTYSRSPVTGPSLILASPGTPGTLDNDVGGNLGLSNAATVLSHGSAMALQGMASMAEGDLLSRVRQLGLTQKELAEQVSCSQQYLSQLFCGRRRVSPRMRQAFERLVVEGLGARAGRHQVPRK